MSKYNWRYWGALALLVAFLSGCYTRADSISGFIYEIPGSGAYILTGHVDKEEFWKPLKGASVCIFFDENLKDSTDRCVETNIQGGYVLSLRDLPKPKNESSYYYLSVKKSGFEDFKVPFVPGKSHPFIRNTIFLERPPGVPRQ